MNPLTSSFYLNLLSASTNTEVNSEYIHIPSLSHHGTEGKPLLLPVETHFQLDEVEIQGTWSHTTKRGTRTTLVTFTKNATITDMMYRNHILFREPNISLLIRKLNEEDEGDYHLNLNIQFHNKKGLVKEERTVHVIVDGECFKKSFLVCPYWPVNDTWQNPKFTNYILLHSSSVHSGHWEAPIICSCWGQGECYLDLFCWKRNTSCVSVAEEQCPIGSPW